MDEQLQAKIEEARAAGYSDEEIQQYLATKDQPLPTEQPIDRGGEYGAVAETMGASIGAGALDTAAKAIEYGIPAAAAYKIMSRPPTAPVAPAQTAQNFKVVGTGTSPATYNVPTSTPGSNTIQFPKSTPAIPQGAPASSLPTSNISAAQSIIQKLALDKVLKGAGVIGAGAALGQNLFGTSDEEIRILKEAEARKRAQGWKPLNER